MGASCKTAELCNGVARIHTHKQTHSVLKKVKFNCMAQKWGLLNFFLISLRTIRTKVSTYFAIFCTLCTRVLQKR